MKYVPHDYQVFMQKFIIDNPACGCLLDMGLGKTIITLSAIDELLYDYFESYKILVIAPLRVAQSTWSDEIEKWDHLKLLRVSKVLGTVKQRIAALERQADIYLINRENVEWIVQHYGMEWPFNMVVVDELSSFKSTKANRFRQLRKVRPLAKRIIGLTGTPAPNGLIDLWPQIYLLDMGERLGKTVTAYRDRYFYPGMSNGHVVYKWALKEEAERAIYDKISDICVSLKAEDWLKMPEKISNTISVTMEDKDRERYKQLERDLLLPHAEGDIVANGAAVLSNKLLQLANGAIYNEDGEVVEIHKEKLYALEDVLEFGGNTLVYYWYKHDLDRLLRHFPKAVKLETQKDIKDWNAGKTKLMLVHPASAGHGLNLQAGGSTIVWFGLTWSLELYQQANARLYRQGQTRNVIIHHLVTKGTIDEDVMKALERKDHGQNALINAVKAKIEEVVRR